MPKVYAASRNARRRRRANQRVEDLERQVAALSIRNETLESERAYNRFDSSVVMKKTATGDYRVKVDVGDVAFSEAEVLIKRDQSL